MKRSRIVAYVPAIVLACVALIQVYLVNAHGLSPWKGGGFGMFSTIDGTRNRLLRLYIVRGPEERRIEIPRGLEADVLRARLLPTDRNLTAVAERFVEQSGDRIRGTDAVRVEIWRGAFDPERVSLKFERWRALTHDLNDRG